MVLVNAYVLKAQESFKGELTYSIDYKYLNKELGKINKEQNKNGLSTDTITYYYSSNGDYASILKKNDTIFTLYKAKDLTLYGFDTSEYVSGLDVRIDLEEKLGNKPQVDLLKDTVKIGNTECQVVRVKWKTGEYKYYFNKNFLKINPSLYKGYEYDQWYNFLLISGALPVKIEKTIYGIITVTLNLEYYENYEVDEEMFKLPKLKEDPTMSQLYLNKKIYTYVEK